MRQWNIGIVGGGPGGLMLAYLLQKQATTPFKLTLFEASQRLGGKIRTERFRAAPATYEAGAAELYDYSPVGEDPLRELVAELGLATRPMGGATVVLDDRILANATDLRAHLGPAAWGELERFDRLAHDWMSPREYFNSDLKVGTGTEAGTSFQSVLATLRDPGARRYLETMVHSDLATEPHLTNAVYGLQNYLMNDPAYMRLYSIDGGLERLPQELARRIEADVLLGQRVRRIERADDGQLCVTSTREDAVTEDCFDFVVVALPNHLLPRIEWGGDRLAAALRGHHRHYHHPAHYLRVSILFAEPFWRSSPEESYFMLDAFGGCCLYDESARNGCTTHGVLGWLLGGAPALELSRRSDEELIRAALDSLPSFLRQGKDLFVEGRVHRWIEEVNGMPGGHPARPLAERHQPEPRDHPNLFLVGDYLFDSTLNGVLDSAECVAEWLTVEMEAGGRRAVRKPARRACVGVA